MTIPAVGVEPAIPKFPTMSVAADAAEVGRHAGAALRSVEPLRPGDAARNVLVGQDDVDDALADWPARSSLADRLRLADVRTPALEVLASRNGA